MTRAEAEQVADKFREIHKHYLDTKKEQNFDQGELDFEFDFGSGQEKVTP